MLALHLSSRMIPPRLQAALTHPAVGALLVYLVGIALRLKYTLDLHRPEEYLGSDMSIYLAHAQRLLASHGPTVPWDVMLPLGFPSLLAFMLSGGGSLASAGHVQLLVGCLVPLAVGLLGAAAFGRRTGFVALAVASLYFPFIEYGALLLTEIHFTLWLTLAFAAFLAAIDARRRSLSLALAAAGGLALSIAISMKTIGLIAALAFFATDGVARLLARRDDGSRAPSAWWARLRPWLLRGALVAVGAAPLLGVMTKVCTRANNGHFCFSGNKPGADFLLGHYGQIEGIDWLPSEGMGAGFTSPGVYLRHYQGRRQLAWMIEDNAANAAEAWRWIGEHPFDAVVLSLDHVYDTFFGPAMWPSFGQESWPFAHLFQYLFVCLLFVPTLFLLQRVARGGLRAFLTSRAVLVLSPLGGLAFAVAVATGEVRYRVPFDVFFIVAVCAFAVGELKRRDDLSAEV